MNRPNDLQPPAGSPIANSFGSVSPVQAPGALSSSKRPKNLIGLRFGRLLVESRAPNGSRGEVRWRVRCACKNKKIVSGSNLRSGGTTSCGCFRRGLVHKRLKLPEVDLTGKRFGRRLVTGRAPTTPRVARRWFTLCACGRTQIVSENSLRYGHAISCGCYRDEKSRARRGVLSARWNPSLTEEDRRRRRLGTPLEKKLSGVAQTVRRRDRAVCLVCHAPDSTHVHHIEPWAVDRDLRYDPANLVTLCKECHNQFHYLYGNDAGLDELEEFLRETPVDSTKSNW
jgi:5-methylcytosine-specific restriction endonuclease McrA